MQSSCRLVSQPRRVELLRRLGKDQPQMCRYNQHVANTCVATQTKLLIIWILFIHNVHCPSWGNVIHRNYKECTKIGGWWVGIGVVVVVVVARRDSARRARRDSACNVRLHRERQLWQQWANLWNSLWIYVSNTAIEAENVKAEQKIPEIWYFSDLCLKLGDRPATELKEIQLSGHFQNTEVSIFNTLLPQNYQKVIT